ncbi:HAD family hydrolase, partial [Candidatus Woesearchaeota archaeon]|nr:HAD family hydrolase [Candidatus Woesearchaeota archaeon]
MLQAIIFDFDGVLAPTSIRQEKWFKFYSERNKKEWPFASFDEFLTSYNEACALPGGVQNFYDKLGLPCDMKDRKHPVWPAYEEFNQKNPSGLYEGVKETIEEIWALGHLGKNPLRNRRLRLAINTSNSWKSIYKDLSDGEILPYFDAHITEETLLAYHGLEGDCMKKPAAVSLTFLLGRIGSEGKYTLHVGDTRNDLHASQKIIRLNPQKPESVITVGACYGYEGRATLEQGVELPSGERVHFNHLIDKP